MSPYSNPDPAKQELNYEWAKLAVVLFTMRGVPVYSPIVHSHPVAVSYNLPGNSSYWFAQNQAFMERSGSATIFTVPGWENSQGIKEEVSEFSLLGKALSFLSPEEAIRELRSQGISLPPAIASLYPELSSQSPQASDLENLLANE
jgi:hypothetical protein